MENEIMENIPSENKKYMLLEDNTIRYCGTTLHQIKYLKTFETELGGVIQSGDIGGYIESEDNLSQEGNCYVDPMSVVVGSVKIKDNACLEASSVVCLVDGLLDAYGVDNVEDVPATVLIEGNAVITYSRIIDGVHIKGNVNITHSVVNGTSCVDTDGQPNFGIVIDCDDAEIYRSYIASSDHLLINCANLVMEQCNVYDNTIILGSPRLQNSYFYGNPIVFGNAEIFGSTIRSNARVGGNAILKNAFVRDSIIIDNKICKEFNGELPLCNSDRNIKSRPVIKDLSKLVVASINKYGRTETIVYDPESNKYMTRTGSKSAETLISDCYSENTNVGRIGEAIVNYTQAIANIPKEYSTDVVDLDNLPDAPVRAEVNRSALRNENTVSKHAISVENAEKYVENVFNNSNPFFLREE